MKKTRIALFVLLTMLSISTVISISGCSKQEDPSQTAAKKNDPQRKEKAGGD
jgi:hypothetical protein